jgi:CheY-like chemotaxis protein/HPt (histidine-containing phosphotransfer) domain-containing protein
MPGMDGQGLKAAIIADPDMAPRLVMMTGLRLERNLATAAESGIAASLSKPVHREDLRSCLRIALGLQMADVPSSEVTEALATPSARQERGKLLLAEDNLINQKVAVAMLSSAGYRVDTVLDGAAAVEAAAAERYDAILMDCQMPELNGYEATAAIRAHEGSDRHTPIIAMTAGARREDRDRCLVEGMDSYLAKPVSKDALLALVARFVDAEPISPAPVQHPGRVVGVEDAIDADVFGELRILDETAEGDLLSDLVGQFFSDTEPLLVELREALEEGDASAVGRIAHSIKGTSVQLGGRRLALSCGRLELKANNDSLSDGQRDLMEVEIDYKELRSTLTEQLSSSDQPQPRSLHA